MVSLESKTKEIEKFRRTEKRGVELLMGIRKEREYRVIGEISGKNFIKKLLNKNIVIKINNEDEISSI